MLKAVALVLIFFGEALLIAVELIASKRGVVSISEGGAFYSLVFLAIVIAGVALVGGYMLGYANLKNIWIIVVISIGSILIVEPFMTALVFREAPTLGAGVGLVLGAAGIISALLF
ncbi:MAG: hypothetical protein JO019_03125 [Candidatus Kaiserbacteria bacterium]|nr:hypothetical protein [Candidatus Kaiserbacteria bacterium]